MKIPVNNQTFRGQDIYLDGHSWQKCFFIKCNIIIERGEYDLVNCDFNECKLTAKGTAIAILKVAQLFHSDMPIWIDGEETKNQVLERMIKRLEKEGYKFIGKVIH